MTVRVSCAIAVCLSLAAASSAQEEMIQGGDFGPGSDAFWTTGTTDVGPVTWTFDYTGDGPAGGQGGCLRVVTDGTQDAGGFVYQAVTLGRGITYTLSGAWKSPADPGGGYWLQVYLFDEQPVDGQDYGPPGGQNDPNAEKNWWYTDGAATVWDDTFADGEPHENPAGVVLEITPPTTSTYYLTIKAGTGSNPGTIDFMIDSVSLMSTGQVATGTVISAPAAFNDSQGVDGWHYMHDPVTDGALADLQELPYYHPIYPSAESWGQPGWSIDDLTVTTSDQATWNVVWDRSFWNPGMVQVEDSRDNEVVERVGIAYIPDVAHTPELDPNLTYSGTMAMNVGNYPESDAEPVAFSVAVFVGETLNWVSPQLAPDSAMTPFTAEFGGVTSGTPIFLTVVNSVVDSTGASSPGDGDARLYVQIASLVVTLTPETEPEPLAASDWMLYK